MSLQPQDIHNAYNFILGRSPEPGIDLVKAGQRYGHWRTLRNEIFASNEARGVMWDALATHSASRWFKHTTYFDRSIYLCTSDSAVSKQIFITGAWEPDVANGLRRFFTPDMCFVDVGANIGWFTLLAADYISRQNGSGIVYSIEANAYIIPYLAASVVDSSLARYVKLFPYAASDIVQLVAISGSTDGNIGGLGITANLQLSDSLEQQQIVPAVPLDAILSKVSRIDLIKLDIEGAEPQALAGLSETLRRFRPAIFVEMNPSALQSASARSPSDLYQQMFELDYDCYDFQTADTITKVTLEDISKRLLQAGYYDYLFLPRK
jgi:FkbM family methyltransferase